MYITYRPTTLHVGRHTEHGAAIRSQWCGWHVEIVSTTSRRREVVTYAYVPNVECVCECVCVRGCVCGILDLTTGMFS